MPDDLKKHGNQDGIRVNVHQDFERRDWARKLGVSEDSLVAAVKEAGPMVKDVKTWLQKKGLLKATK